MEEYKNNKKELQEKKDLLNIKLKELQKQNKLKSQDEIVRENLKNVYEILTDDKIDMKRKYDVSHMIIDNIYFLRDEGLLEMSYKL